MIDREPAATDWDLLFTKYYDESETYSVTGVLNNPKTGAVKLTEIDPTTVEYDNEELSTNRKVIGSNWKEFSMETMSYTVFDDIAFFVKIQNNDLYKMYFTGFERETGNITFIKKYIETTFRLHQQVEELLIM